MQETSVTFGVRRNAAVTRCLDALPDAVKGQPMIAPLDRIAFDPTYGQRQLAVWTGSFERHQFSSLDLKAQIFSPKTMICLNSRLIS